MMKHESGTKTLPKLHDATGGGGGSNGNESTSPALKRGGLFRTDKQQRHLLDVSYNTPRSPITKAFDFLPWGRKNKTQEKKENAEKLKQSEMSNEHDGVVVNYQRNIFRNGGGIIRDILGDKLNKDKAAQLTAAGSQQPQQQRRQTKFLGRNKSLDIHELINCVENELDDEAATATATLKGHKKMLPTKRFLDDTFIENAMRAKVEYNNNNNNNNNNAELKEYEHGAECMHCVDEVPTTTTTTTTIAQQHSPTTQRNKHILFNDENTVYLIKKELPVKRDARAHSRKLPPTATNAANTNNTTTTIATNANANVESSRAPKQAEHILRARLRFKRLRSDGEMQQQQQQQLNNRSRSLQRQHIYANDYRDYEAHSPEPALRTRPPQSPSHQRERHKLQRRKSLSDSFYEQQSNASTSSSTCSSMCSHNGCAGSSGGVGAAGSGGGGGIMLDRPKTDRPRKKLSFREPIVADKSNANAESNSGGGGGGGDGRVRRRSSPLERTVSGAEGVAERKQQQQHSVRSCDNLYNNNRAKDAISCGNFNVGGATTTPTPTATTSLLSSSMTPSTYGTDESQAMRIVRTVGQAFEVCHKFNLHKNSLEPNDERSDVSSELLDVEQNSEQQLSDDGGTSDLLGKKDHLASMPDLNHAQPQRPNHLELLPLQSSLNVRKTTNGLSDGDDKSLTTPTSPHTEITKLKDQLEQQALQTRQALGQLMLVREQLISETNARIEAQARTQQLLQQNRELLEHLASLGAYNEQQTPGLTSANIGIAPQSQLQMLLQATSNNNNLATINQQISNLGNINQQLNSLSQQLSGLNQQTQNLQNLQNMQQQQQQTQAPPTTPQTQQQTPPASTSTQQLTTTPTPMAAALRQSQLQLNVSAANAIGATSTSTASLSPFPSMNQLQNISSQLAQLNTHQQQQQQAQDSLSKDLFQVNQELLNRLQALNINAGTSGAAATAATAGNATPAATAQQTPNAFFYVNPMSCSPANNNNNANNFNFLSSPNALGGGNLTPSPMSTLNRNSYASIEQNLNSLDEQLKAAVSNGNLAGVLASGSRDNSRSSSTIDSPSSPHLRCSPNPQQQQQQQLQLYGNTNNNNNNNSTNTNHNPHEARFNTVMLRVTDEAGNVTNQRKLSATPSFITRTTSEKVPNRSQMMSQVQRTAWARHTTK